MSDDDDIDTPQIPDGLTPLIRAIRNDSKEAAESLIQIGANPAFVVKMNVSAFSKAIDNSKIDQLQTLTKSGITPKL